MEKAAPQSLRLCGVVVCDVVERKGDIASLLGKMKANERSRVQNYRFYLLLSPLIS